MTGKATRTLRRNQRWGFEPGQIERVERTEHEEARRAMRDWLRDRDEDDVPEWDELSE